MRLTIDFETRSACDLKTRGAWVYGEHPTTEIICCAVKADNDPARIWLPEWSLKIVMSGGATALPLLTNYELFKLLEEAETIEAHNAGFEVAMWIGTAIPKYGWPAVPFEKIRCSLAACSYHALPRGLGAACEVMRVPQQKDQEGYNLMMRMCRPREISWATLEPLVKRAGV